MQTSNPWKRPRKAALTLQFPTGHQMKVLNPNRKHPLTSSRWTSRTNLRQKLRRTLHHPLPLWVDTLTEPLKAKQVVAGNLRPELEWNMGKKEGAYSPRRPGGEVAHTAWCFQKRERRIEEAAEQIAMCQ